MSFSPRMKLLFLLWGIGLVGRWRLSLIFSLSWKNTLEDEQFAANIQQAIPQEIEWSSSDQQPESPKEPQQKEIQKERAEPKNQTQPTVEQNTSQITVLVPPLLSKKDWESIKQTIDDRSQQNTRTLYYPSWNLYENAVQSALNDEQNHDIILLPSLRFKSLEWQWMRFALEDRTGSIFHPMMHEWLFNDTMSILPFSVDPWVIGAYKEWAYESTASIIAQVNNDQNAFVFDPVSNSWQKTLQQFTAESMLTRSLSHAARSWAKRWISFLLLGKVLPDNECNGLLSRCSFISEKSNATMAPLSHFWAVEDNLTFYPAPIDTGDYPVLWRGFIVPRSSDNQTAAAQWLASYVELSGEWGILYPQHLFSASIRTLQWQRIESQYSKIGTFFTTKNVIAWSIDDVSYAQSSHVTAYLSQTLTLNELLQRIGDILP